MCRSFNTRAESSAVISQRGDWRMFSRRIVFFGSTSVSGDYCLSNSLPLHPLRSNTHFSVAVAYIYLYLLFHLRGFILQKHCGRAFITRQQISLAFYSSGAVHRPQVFFLHLSIYLQTLGLIIKIKLTGFSFSSSQPVHRPQLLKPRKSKARQRRRWIHSDSFTARGE